MAIEKFNLIFDSATTIAPGVKHLNFHREDQQELAFMPGQFITFLFEVDGKIKRRSYSLANIPGQELGIQIAVSYVKGGIASDKLFNLSTGESLPAMGPAGRLLIQAENADRHIFVGTGTGIAPYRAMLNALAAIKAKVVILAGVQYRDDLLYGDDFQAFAKQYNHAEFHACFSRDKLDQQKPDECKGYVQQQFDQLKLNPEQDLIYLCGNPNMIDDAFADLTARGFETKQIKREKYISSN